MTFFYFILSIGISWYFCNRLKERISSLERENEDLHTKTKSALLDLQLLRIELKKIKEATNTQHIKDSTVPTNQLEKPIEETPPPLPAKKKEEIAPVEFIPPIPKTNPFPKPEIKIKQPSLKDSEFWKKIEEQFSTNATGIIGTLAVVLGVIFLGVYAAIQLNPPGRFAVVVAFSVAFYALYVYLNRSEYWKNISLWLRSASGITFLIGCLGSVGIDSMKWVSDPWMALGLLSLGLSTNLIFGFLNKGEMFASVHVILSLISLSLIPVNQIIFIIAAIVTFVGLLMSSKDRNWDIHVILTSIGFTWLHIFWIYEFSPNLHLFPVPALEAILISAAIGIAGIMAHYRQIYQSKSLSILPLSAHLMVWITSGINIYLHAQESKLSSLALYIASIAIYGLSVYGKRLDIKWLYLTDRLLSLLLALLATLSLKHYGIAGYEISVIASIVSIIFLRIISESYEPFLFKISSAATLITYSFTAIYTFLLVTENNSVQNSFPFMILGSFIIFALSYPGIAKHFNQDDSTYIEFPLSFHSFLAFLLAYQLRTQYLFLLIPFAINFYLLYLRNKIKNENLDLSFLTSLFLSLAIALFKILEPNNLLINNIILSLGFIITGALLYKYRWAESIKQNASWPGIFILWSIFSVGAYSFTVFYSPLLPGLLWIFMFLLAGELKESHFLNQEENPHAQSAVFVGYLGIASLICFYLRFFLVDISNHVWAFGMIRVRTLSEFLVLASLLYWIKYSKKIIIPYLLEVFMLTGSIFVLYEIQSHYHPVIWGVISFLCYFAGKNLTDFKKLKLYSHLYYFATLFHIAFLSSLVTTPSIQLLDQSWIMGLIAVALSTTFMVFTYKNKDQEFNLKIMLYPLFLAIGFFLYWSFDKTLLSLLWVVECFVLFLISIFMREPQFRISSMAGIAIIFLRIIFYDLTGQNFFIKAIVFICIGITLILMNTIYNKYKYRYETNQQ